MERFDGTELDTETWRYFAPENPPGTFTQDNALTINKFVFSSDGTARGTTQAVLLQPGQTVRALVKFGQKTDSSSASLFITNQLTPAASPLEIGVTALDNRGWVSERRSTGGASQGTFINSSQAQPTGAFYTFQIEWLDQLTVRTSVFDPQGASLGSVTQSDLTFLPNQMRVSLRTQASITTFDDVTIVPEPVGAAAAVLFSCFAGAARRPRRRTF